MFVCVCSVLSSRRFDVLPAPLHVFYVSSFVFNSVSLTYLLVDCSCLDNQSACQSDFPLSLSGLYSPSTGRVGM